MLFSFVLSSRIPSSWPGLHLLWLLLDDTLCIQSSLHPILQCWKQAWGKALYTCFLLEIKVKGTDLLMWLGLTDFHTRQREKELLQRSSREPAIQRHRGRESKSLQAKLRRCMLFPSSSLPLRCSTFHLLSLFLPSASLFVSLFTNLYLPYCYLTWDRT